MIEKNPLHRITVLLPGIILINLVLLPLYGQRLSRQEYQDQLRKALQEKSYEQIQQLLKTERGEAIRYLEALLDSGVVEQSSGKIESGQTGWQLARELAHQYREVFQDNFYTEKSKRYNHFNSIALAKKASIIRLKNSCRKDFYSGNFQTALDKYQQALDLANEISDIDEQGALLGNIGACRFYLGDFDAALEYYFKSLVILEKIGDSWRIGNRLGNIASVYNDKSDYPTAITYYIKAITVRNELDDRIGLAADHNNIGLVYEEMGDYSLAIDHYQTALTLNRQTDNTRGIGKNLANLANVQINFGNYAQALDLYEESLALRRELGDRKGAGNDLGNIGIIYLSLGDYNKARTYYQEALAIHQELGYKEGEAYQLGRLAEMYTYQGEYAKAIQTYQEAFKIHEEMGHVHGAAGWLEALGEVYLAVGDNDRSIETLRLALEKHRSIGNRSGEANTLTKIGNVYLKTGKIQKAKECFRKALAINSDLEEKWGQCVNLANLAYINSLEGDRETALINWSKATKFAEQLGEVRLQARIYLQLADFYREQEESEKSARDYEQGLAILEELDDPELRWQLYFGQGRLWEKLGDHGRAYYSYRAAVTAIEEIRGKARVEELKAGVVHNRFDAYESIITLLLKMDRAEEAFQYVERARARNLLDVLGNTKVSARRAGTQSQIEREQSLRNKISQLLKQISLENENRHGNIRGPALETYKKSLHEAQEEYHRLLLDLKLRNPEYAAMIEIEPLTIADIQRLLPPETALLEYLLTEENILIFIITSKGLNFVTFPEGRDFIRGKITLFQGTAVRYITEQKLKEKYWIAPLQGLYQALIEPAEEAGLLTGKTNLIIVPEGILHYLPFQALINNKSASSHFLIEDYIITYAPSASHLQFCRGKQVTEKNNLLLLAPRIQQLPMSEREVTAIASGYGEEARYYLNGEATESLVKREGGDYRLLHFATTAYFNNANPLFSRLALSASDQDDGNLEVHEIFGLDLHTSLVGLSACQTAIGSGYTETIPRGDDLISLSRAFIYAGTASVLASLWEVADPSTATLMEHFYENLKNMPKGEALAQAQREMIAGKYNNSETGNYDYTHPYHWAPFVLVGDWE